MHIGESLIHIGESLIHVGESLVHVGEPLVHVGAQIVDPFVCGGEAGRYIRAEIIEPAVEIVNPLGQFPFVHPAGTLPRLAPRAKGVGI